MAADRFERTRAAWVLSHAGRRPGARRRGERLMLAATRADRASVSAGDVAATETVTPGLLHRVSHREDGGLNAIGWILGLLVLAVLVVWLAGPGLLLGWLVYIAWWWLVPKIGAVKITPLAVLTVLVAVGCAISWWLFPTTGFWETVTSVRHALWWTGAPAFAAWLAWAWGWSAVKTASSPSTKRTNFDRQEPGVLGEDDGVDEDDDVLTVDNHWWFDPPEPDTEDRDNDEDNDDAVPEDEPFGPVGDNETTKERENNE